MLLFTVFLLSSASLISPATSAFPSSAMSSPANAKKSVHAARKRPAPTKKSGAVGGRKKSTESQEDRNSERSCRATETANAKKKAVSSSLQQSRILYILGLDAVKFELCPAMPTFTDPRIDPEENDPEVMPDITSASPLAMLQEFLRVDARHRMCFLELHNYFDPPSHPKTEMLFKSSTLVVSENEFTDDTYLEIAQAKGIAPLVSDIPDSSTGRIQIPHMNMVYMPCA